MKTIKRILLPTDFSELSLAALETVRSLALRYNAQVYVMNVVEDELSIAPFPNVDLNSETILRDTLQKAKEQLHRVTMERMSILGLVIEVVRRGVPWKEILHVAQEENIDLIVMATHGRSGLARVLVGSIAEQVVRNSPAPVLTVKPESISAQAAGNLQEHSLAGMN